MKLAASLLLFCLCGPLLCLATETTPAGTTTTAKTSSSGTVTPQHENDTSPKILPVNAPSPVTYIKQEPVVEHKADLNDFIKEVLNVGDAPSSAEVSSQTAASDEAAEDEVHQNVRIQELLKGILADEFGSEEDDEEDLADFDSDEPDVFHEDAGNSSDDADDDDNEEELFTTTEAPDGTVTTTSTDVEDEINEDGKTTDAGATVTPSDRASRAEESSTKGKSSRKVNRRRNGGGKKQKNGKKDNMARYNRYVDLVFKRMNTLIRSKRMDPLRVNLYAGSNNNNGSKNNNNSNSSNNNPKRSGSQGKPQGGKRGGRPGSKYSKKNKNNNDVIGQRRAHQKHRAGGYRPPRFEVDHPYVFEEIHRQDRQDDNSEETSMDNKMRPSSLESLSNRTTTSTTHAPEETATGSESKEMKPQNGNGNRPTRGILRGLSTLKRQGQVKVIRRSASVSVLRSAFSLGPVALDILQKSANSSKPETAATATAQKLKGVLEIRLKNSGPTRIRRLRVFPPRNVRVKGEKTGLKKQGYRKITPVAAKRLMSVANQVVRQSDQSRGRPGKNNSKNNNNKNNKNKVRPAQKRPAAGQATKPHNRNNNNRGKGPNSTRNNNGGARRKIPRDDRHEQ